MNRREVLQTLAGLVAGLTATSTFDVTTLVDDEASKKLKTESPKTLPRRKLGKTGVELPILGVGGFHVGMHSEKVAKECIDAALEEGVLFFDTAESYQGGTSEVWLGRALKEHRKNVFLMTKTFTAREGRTAESAKKHLGESLERLGTDYLDLWQLHSIRSVEDVEKAFREGGAMEYITEMKKKGVVKHIGVTGHIHPAAHLRALEFFDAGWEFDTMQFPVNPIDFHQQSFQKDLLPEVVKRGIGVLAMKTSAAGRLAKDGICTIEECLRFVVSLPISVAIVGMESADHVRENARILRESKPFTADECDKLLSRIEPRAALELEWYKKDK